MNTRKRIRRHSTWLLVLCSLVASVQLSAQDSTPAPAKKTDSGTTVTTTTTTTTTGAATGDDSENTVKMNPFLVSEDTVKGYLASDTASGSKVAMKIIDIPQTLNVITRAAMDDSGLSDPNALFSTFAPAVSNLTGPGI
jgi:outer membrane receptor for ferric coprogen and ferric-rhodotorulic acid